MAVLSTSHELRRARGADLVVEPGDVVCCTLLVAVSEMIQGPSSGDHPGDPAPRVPPNTCWGEVGAPQPRTADSGTRETVTGALTRVTVDRVVRRCRPAPGWGTCRECRGEGCFPNRGHEDIGRMRVAIDPVEGASTAPCGAPLSQGAGTDTSDGHRVSGSAAHGFDAAHLRRTCWHPGHGSVPGGLVEERRVTTRSGIGRPHRATSWAKHTRWATGHSARTA